ncbi:FeoC-like transcriptional regulator [Enterovibrio calviensis]|uniref:FeoC-like transcriptional regulator n=1 Tax=Enterovibrio calviensis TaxID=91359 RepID=UPI00048245E5|nr:FeoC-like transcriptional regulator [Enterovibrio calviensis]
MILDDLRDYIVANPNCTLTTLATHFSLSADGIDAMLAVWVKKGQLKTTISQSHNGVERRYLWVQDQELGITVIQ